MNHLVQEEMFRLWTNAQYKLAIVYLKSYHSKNLFVKSLNTCLLTLHLLASHILCLNETRIINVHLNSKIYNALSQKFHILSCYDDNVSLTESTTITNFGAKLYHHTF